MAQVADDSAGPESNISVLLAHTYEEGKIDPTGWWMSEKLDGVRAYWNGQYLFSRHGNAFHPPPCFTEDLPHDMHLDGELFGGRKTFQSTLSIVKTSRSPRWREIKYWVSESQRGSYRSSYTQEDLLEAYNAVFEEKIPVERAAKRFGVPINTLKDRVRGKVHVDTVKSGPSPLFSQEQEALLCRHLSTMAEIGYGYSRQETINVASDFAHHLGLCDKSHSLSLQWLYNFLNRWPELKVKKPRSLDIARAKSATRPIIDAYFLELGKILNKYNLMEKPHCIYNIDEKGLSTNHKPPKIVTGFQYKAQAVTGGKSQTTTVIGGGNAVGQQVPPFFVFPGKRMQDGLLEGASAGASGTMSESGWSNTEIFSQYMQEHLIKYLPARNKESHVLVLYDGHRSHVSLSLIEWARQNHIILFVLPPHCSHLLQPLDVSCYGPFEIAWNSACHNYLRESGGNVVTRYEVCKLACKVYAAALSPTNIQSAFKRCGVYPYNPSVISDTVIAPSLAFPSQEPKVAQFSSGASNIVVPPSDENEGDQTAKSFLEKRGGELLKNIKKAKVRKTLSKVVSGKAITEANITDQIKSHMNSSKSKPFSKKKNVKTALSNHIKPAPGLESTKLKQINKKKTVKTSVSHSKSATSVSKEKGKSQKPIQGPSGTRQSTVTVNTENEDYSSSDESVPESEKCCVCKKFTPIEIRNAVSLVFTKWGCCDSCQRWVHLQYCSPIKVLRLGDSFFCPECTEKREQEIQ